ncbi:N-acetyl-gamma-glutamyl-phosphate reductase [Pelagibacteraceae bacterium]|nr:N-acetyl-gamma-glutamyl-phosphate reductase [Pelagibacteraceae bacterium]
MKDSLNIAIAGATGYVGLELIKILTRHPKVKILYLCAQKSIGKSINSIDKKIKKKNLPKLSKIENINWNKINVIFTALPNGEAQNLVKKIPNNVKLIDLSADFRLSNHKTYKKWYGHDHKSKNLIKNSIYAITEFTRKKIKKHRIISCPGCYSTSIQIPLVPLVKNKMLNIKKIIIDSKSGYSGAGKNIKKKFKFKNLFNSVSAYGLGSHRHMAEIDQELTKIAKKDVNVFFTPHLMPMFRGILSTIYIETKGNISARKIYNFLKRYHKKNFFVKISKFNYPIGTGEVINTNFCNISVCEDRKKGKVIILSTIDNLIKGASGQAVQNMNIAFNMKETLGLI